MRIRISRKKDTEGCPRDMGYGMGDHVAGMESTSMACIIDQGKCCERYYDERTAYNGVGRFLEGLAPWW